MSQAGEMIYALELKGEPESSQWALELGFVWLWSYQRQAQLSIWAGEDYSAYLKWLGLPLSGAPGSAPWRPQLDEFPTPALAEMREAGVLPEMLLSYLIQRVWRPQERPSCRPLSEIARYWEPQESYREARNFSWEELLEITAERLRELTPRELLAVAEAEGFELGSSERPTLEAWLLLASDRFHSVHDVLRHLSQFFEQPAFPRRLPLPAAWWEEIQSGDWYPGEELESALLFALIGERQGDLSCILPLLGRERCERRVQSGDEP